MNKLAMNLPFDIYVTHGVTSDASLVHHSLVSVVDADSQEVPGKSQCCRAVE